MKALALATIAVAIGFTSVSFAQNCGLIEGQADTSGTATWNDLKYYLITRFDNDRKHWDTRKQSIA
jgi:hypothetical protein